MSAASDSAVGKRVRITRPVLGTQIGAEGRIVKIVYTKGGCLACLEVLIDSTPGTIHGATVYPTEYILLEDRDTSLE